MTARKEYVANVDVFFLAASDEDAEEVIASIADYLLSSVKVRDVDCGRPEEL
jgi:hypothetical protein